MLIFNPKKILILTLIFLLPAAVIKSQTFGFGCLGLSGFYAGFTQQQYVAGGLNDYIKYNNYGPVPSSNIEFKKGSGYRIGANLFRAKFESFFISAKGYYQFMRENIEQSKTAQNSLIQNKYQFSMNHWGLAIDIGVPLFSIIDLKIIEGGVVFYNSEFVHTVLENEKQLYELKYEPDNKKVNYYIASGLLIHIVPDYISIEGTAGFSFLKYDQFDLKSELPVGAGKITSPVSKGGFLTTVQLNIGFPL